MCYKPESNIGPVHPGGWLQGDVKLGSIAMWALIGHSENAPSIVGNGKALISNEERQMLR